MREIIDGHKTYKMEATPVDASRSQYKYMYDWVAQDVPVILFAEMYDAQGRKVRVLHATDLKREDGIWGARHTEMRTVQDGTRTVLTIDSVKFNTKPDEKMFTPQGLAGALGSRSDGRRRFPSGAQATPRSKIEFLNTFQRVSPAGAGKRVAAQRLEL